MVSYNCPLDMPLPPKRRLRIVSMYRIDTSKHTYCRIPPPSDGGGEQSRGGRRPALADFVGSVQPGAAEGVAFDGGDHVIEAEAGWQTGVAVKGEELEDVGVRPVRP